jgi:hypothetical protein
MRLLKLEVEGVSEVYGIVNLYDVFPTVCWEPCGVRLQQYIWEINSHCDNKFS